MSDHSLKINGLISAGVLVSSLAIGRAPVTGATVVENEPGVIREYHQGDFSADYRDAIHNTDRFLNHYENITIGTETGADDYFEPEVIEIPVVKRMVFQFKKPVKLEFV